MIIPWVLVCNPFDHYITWDDREEEQAQQSYNGTRRRTKRDAQDFVALYVLAGVRMHIHRDTLVGTDWPKFGVRLLVEACQDDNERIGERT